MTRKDVYAFLEELEPAERLFKKFYQNHQPLPTDYTLSGQQYKQYLKWTDKYKPHPSLKKWLPQSHWL